MDTAETDLLRQELAADLRVLADVTTALGRTTATFDDEDARRPSLLPGWSRGHVLSHVSRNADGMCHLVSWARDGRPRPMYPSAAARDADIEAGSHRSARLLLHDVTVSAARLQAALEELADLPDDAIAAALRRDVVFGAPRPGAVAVPAAALPAARAREVAIHHADLAAGYGPQDWPAPLARRILGDVSAARRGPGGLAGVARLVVVGAGEEPSGDLARDIVLAADGRTLRGPVWALAWWCTGRPGCEDRLQADDRGPVPPAVPW